MRHAHDHPAGEKAMKRQVAQQLVAGFFRLTDLSIVLCLAGMVALVFVNVVLRYGFGGGIMVSEELARFLLVWLTFVGGAAAMRSHEHLGVESFVKALPPSGRKLCAGIAIALMLFCLAYFLYGSWLQTGINVDVRSSVMNMPMSFYYGVGIFFSVVAALVLFVDLYGIVSGKTKDEDLIMVGDSGEELTRVRQEWAAPDSSDQKVTTDRRR
jgi:TRAP-type C4-dicarboxylate transport system permease small subunit